MATKSLINMERSYAFYAGGLGLIMVLSLILNNVPELAFTQFFDFPYRTKVSGGLFLFGAALGAWAVYRHMLRAQTPWSIPQSQISIPYIGFLVSSVLALIFSH